MNKLFVASSLLVAAACGGSSSAPASLPTLNTIGSIGSTMDPVEMGGNPYGLAIAPITSGLMTAGDMIICNFNDGATDTEGKGTTIVGLHPTAGAAPYSIANSSDLKGCNAITILPDDSISVSAYVANKNPLVMSNGTLAGPFSSDTFHGPWGEAYVPAASGQPAAVYMSNADAGFGTINRMTLDGDAQGTFTELAKGFCASGEPGDVFAPSGLTYDAALDTLYVVDSSSNSVIAFSDVSTIGTDGIIANGACSADAVTPTAVPTFSGPSAGSAKVIASGGQFNGPLSAALLANGNLIVGNADLNSPTTIPTNLAFEISPTDGVIATKQLDATDPGALFGIVATVDGQGHQLIYFNDDNTSSLMVLSE